MPAAWLNSPWKRALDVVVAVVALPVFIPAIVACCFAVWAEDGGWPLYFAPRVGRNGRTFRLLKIRTMVQGADQTRIYTVVRGDARVLAVGGVLRRAKLDELPQLINVLTGDISLVGPRPNVPAEAGLYSAAERRLLLVRPGITDPATIMFADLADRLEGMTDANCAYREHIRPMKSQLALFYVSHASLILDLRLLAFTVICIVSRSTAQSLLQTFLDGASAKPNI